MDPITAAGFVAAVIQLIDVTAKAVGYLNEVKDAPKDRAKLAREATSLLSLFTDLRYGVEDVASTEDPWFLGLRTLVGDSGPFDEFRAAMEDLADKLKPARGIKKLGFLWPLDKKDVLALLSKIERLKTLVGLALQKDHFQLSLAMKEDVKMGFEELRVSQDFENITRWLAAPDPSLNHNSAQRKKQPTTGEWLTKSRLLSGWKSEASSFLWLHGIPGCGKTVLFSTIVQNVLDTCDLEPESVTAYFYFDFNDSSKQSTESLVRSLVVQLVARCPKLPEALLSAYSRSHNGQEQPGIAALNALLRHILQTYKSVFILVDALDECTDRDDLLDTLDQISTWGIDALHILATSRKERDLEEALMPLLTRQLSIQNELADADIRVHVLDRVSNDSKLSKWPTEVQREIVDTLLDGAKGMFRWVVCQLDCLRKCLRLDLLRKTLRTLPKTLDDTYQRILYNIDEEYQEDAMKVLRWLCFSRRPMRLHEMVDVLAIDLVEFKFKPEQKLPDPLSILTICSTLICIFAPEPAFDSHSQEISPLENEAGTLRLAHYSVKEYLTSQSATSTLLPHYHISADTAHVSIATACLTYLLYFQVPIDWSTTPFKEHSLAPYAALYWPYHCALVQDGPRKRTLNSLVCRLALSWKYYSNWRELFCSIDLFDITTSGYPFPSKLPLLEMSRLGMQDVVKEILATGIEVNTRDEHGATALHTSCSEQCEAVVRLLLDNGANVNVQDWGSDTPLSKACWLNWGKEEARESVIRMLLERGADCNIQNADGQSALHIAIDVRGLIIVTLLLKEGANVNVKNDDGETPMHYAATIHSDQTLEIMKLLLESGAECDVPDNDGITPLSTAIEQRNVAAMRLLLENGADVNSTAALEAAAMLEYLHCLALSRITVGAHYDAQDVSAQMALMTSTRRVTEPSVQLLLDHGVSFEVICACMTELKDRLEAWDKQKMEPGLAISEIE